MCVCVCVCMTSGVSVSSLQSHNDCRTPHEKIGNYTDTHTHKGILVLDETTLTNSSLQVDSIPPVITADSSSLWAHNANSIPNQNRGTAQLESDYLIMLSLSQNTIFLPLPPPLGDKHTLFIKLCEGSLWRSRHVMVICGVNGRPDRHYHQAPLSHQPTPHHGSHATLNSISDKGTWLAANGYQR